MTRRHRKGIALLAAIGWVPVIDLIFGYDIIVGMLNDTFGRIALGIWFVLMLVVMDMLISNKQLCYDAAQSKCIFRQRVFIVFVRVKELSLSEVKFRVRHIFTNRQRFNEYRLELGDDDHFVVCAAYKDEQSAFSRLAEYYATHFPFSVDRNLYQERIADSDPVYFIWYD